jgi:hypothetical protein
MIKKSSILSIVRLILLTSLLSLFFACSNTSTGAGSSLQEFKGKEGDSKTSNVTDKIWTIPEPYTNVPIEQIKSQIEITDYMTIQGAATDAGTEDMAGTMAGSEKHNTGKSIGATTGAFAKDPPKNVKDRTALATFANKLISLEGVINTTGTQKTAPLDIEERTLGKYEIWFCADKNQKRKPCRNRAHLLYEAPEGKGDTLFTHDNVIRFWGVILGEQIDALIFSGYTKFKRYPKIRVLDLEVIK